MQTLEEAKIVTFSLTSDWNRQELSDGSVIHGLGGFTYDDGTEGIFGDVELAYQAYGLKFVENAAGGFTIELESPEGDTLADTTYFVAPDDSDQTLLLNAKNYTMAQTGAGRDVIDVTSVKQNSPGDCFVVRNLQSRSVLGSRFREGYPSAQNRKRGALAAYHYAERKTLAA